MCDMTHSYLIHDSFISVTCLILTCATWLIRMCDTTHFYVWHDSWTCDIFAGMSHSHVWHDAFMCATWPIHMCDATHVYAWHNSWTCDIFAGINEIFTKFDHLCTIYNVTKIETIGDAFWCAVGVEKPANHADAARLAYMALRMQSLLRDAETYNLKEPTNCSHPILRMGLISMCDCDS